MLADQPGTIFQASQRVLYSPMPHRCRTHHESTVGNGITDIVIFFGAGQQIRRADSGAGRPECLLVRVHYSQMGKTKIAHGASRGPDVERVAGRNQHNTQAIEFKGSGQEWIF